MEIPAKFPKAEFPKWKRMNQTVHPFPFHNFIVTVYYLYYLLFMSHCFVTDCLPLFFLIIEQIFHAL